MTSETTTVFVWVWLPGSTTPVVAGRLDQHGELLRFTYGRSYLARPDRVALYLPELPLTGGPIDPPDMMRIAGCLADAGPDAWGRRVVQRKRLGGTPADSDSLSELDYFLESGSDRFGAIDFQASATNYVARPAHGTLEELLVAAERLEAGEPFSEAIDLALLHGSSLGGARPKAVVNADGRHLIAKFSRASDTYPVVRAEALAMDLARRVGLDVAATELIDSLGRDVLLVQRFDRTAVPGERRMVVSALTILGLDELAFNYASYANLTHHVRQRFTAPQVTLRELFARIAFNICVGNTDDHARNHAAFWDGEHLTLTPAYDICPFPRAGGETRQAMAFRTDGFRLSRLASLVHGAAAYQLSATDAQDIVDHQVGVISNEFEAAADQARLSAADRQQLWGRAILNPYIFEPDA